MKKKRSMSNQFFCGAVSLAPSFPRTDVTVLREGSRRKKENWVDNEGKLQELRVVFPGRFNDDTRFFVSLSTVKPPPKQYVGAWSRPSITTPYPQRRQCRWCCPLSPRVFWSFDIMYSCWLLVVGWVLRLGEGGEKAIGGLAAYYISWESLLHYEKSSLRRETHRMTEGRGSLRV